MTMQPKFIPSSAVNVKFNENARAKIRLVDCVGYLIDGVQGHMDENNKPRLVKTPWSENNMTFEESAEIGTSKVINEHSTIGVLVTTDGSITDLPRRAYVEAEKRVVSELKMQNKPFIIVLNTKQPQSEETEKLVFAMQESYSVQVVATDIEKMNEEDFKGILEKVLLEFPVKQVKIKLPEWMRKLPQTNPIIQTILQELQGLNLDKMADYTKSSSLFEGNEDITGMTVDELCLASGEIKYSINASKDLFYKVLTGLSGKQISNDYDLINYVTELAYCGREYKKLECALNMAKNNGYGVVLPALTELELGEPEVINKSGNSQVKLKAKTSSYHIMKIDVESEVSPAVSGLGLTNISENNEENGVILGDMWSTNMFGKSLSEIAYDGIISKINNFPTEAQVKMRKTLTKITNEGKGGIICILL